MKYEVTKRFSLSYYVQCNVLNVPFNRSSENLSREFWLWIAHVLRARKPQSRGRFELIGAFPVLGLSRPRQEWRSPNPRHSDSWANPVSTEGFLNPWQKVEKL